MKRMICMTLTVFMLLALVSCGSVEYKVYYSGAATKDEGDVGIKVYDVENLHLDNDMELKPPIENTKAPQTKTLTVGKNEFTFSYERTTQYVRDSSSQKSLRRLGKVDEYTMSADGGRVDAVFDCEKGKLVFYSDYRDRDNLGDFTIEDAKQAAEEFVKAQLGKDALDGFELDRAYETDVMDKKELVVNFRKCLYGIETSEYIRVWFDLKGNVVAFNALNTHLFDTAKKELDEKKVKAAESALLDYLSDADHVQEDRKIFVDVKTGIFYLEMVADGTVYYININ